MPLTTASLTATTTWALSAPISGFDARTQQGTLEFSLAGIDTQVWDQFLAESFTITSDGTEGNAVSVDLYDWVNTTCESVQTDHVLSVQLIASGGAVRIEPDAADNPFLGFFGDATSSVVLPDGGCLLISHPLGGSGWNTSATERNLLVTNLTDSDVTVTLVAICSSTGSVTDVSEI